MFAHFSLLLRELSKSQQTLSKTKQVHAVIIKTRLSNDPFYATRVLRHYTLNDDLTHARKVFEETPLRSVFLWNSIIRAYAQACDFDEAFSMFREMLRSETRPDNFTYACVTRACSDNSDIDGLRIVHGRVITSGLGLDSICGSALVSACSKLGLVDVAGKVFRGISQPDFVMWNAMILGCGQCGLWGEGLQLFSEMRRLGMFPDGFTLVGLISGLVGSRLIGIGQGIHGLCLKCNLNSDAHVGSALVSMYARCTCVDSACKVFGALSQPDLVAWSALLTGYCQCGDYEKALSVFRNLILVMEGRNMDHVLIAGAVVAVAHSATIRPGKEIHGFVLRHGLESHVMISSALIDMYSKCGYLDHGMRVFRHMSWRNIVTYNSIISGLGLCGLASRAFQLFDEILEAGLKPDHCTFSALLCACCHAGLIDEGKQIFKRMEDKFLIQPQTEHYIYMVKLLGSVAGRLEEAFDYVWSLPPPVGSGVWGALLSCCEMHGDSMMAAAVARRLYELGPEKGAYRVMLSNAYARDGRWSDATNQRDEMIESGLRKTPGLSWIGIPGY